jgi:hypothetical protein
MKRLGLLLAIMAAALAVSAGAVLAQAQTDTVIAREPVAFGATNPCNGEFIEFTGTFLFQGHNTYDATGNQHSSVGSVAMNITGEGESGTQYRYIVGGGRYIVHETLADPPPIIPEMTTEVFTFQIVSTGDSPNFLMHVTTHYTYNVALGEYTVVVENVRTECTA